MKERKNQEDDVVLQIHFLKDGSTRVVDARGNKVKPIDKEAFNYGGIGDQIEKASSIKYVYKHPCHFVYYDGEWHKVCS